MSTHMLTVPQPPVTKRQDFHFSRDDAGAVSGKAQSREGMLLPPAIGVMVCYGLEGI